MMDMVDNGYRNIYVSTSVHSPTRLNIIRLDPTERRTYYLSKAKEKNQFQFNSIINRSAAKGNNPIYHGFCYYLPEFNS